jgi:arylsulfatase A-like enzyme
LKSAGYRTRAYSANPYISPHFNFDRGFDDFETTRGIDLLSEELFDWEQFAVEHSEEGVRKFLTGLYECIRSDAKTLPSIRRGAEIKLRDFGVSVGPPDDGAREIRSFVERKSFGDRDFLFLNLMEAHEPYNPPDEYASSNSNYPTTVELTFKEHDHSPDDVRTAYDDSVKYLSTVYEEIFDELADDFEVIITCGDHGELFDKRGIWGHFYGVDPELTNIPLHIYRGETEQSEIDTPVSLLDVYSTILDLVNVDKDDARGESLVSDRSSPRPRLVECRGISDKRVAQLRHDSRAIERAERYRNDLFGVIIPPQSYGYDHIKGFSTTGDIPADEAKQMIKNLISELEVETTNSDSIPADVQSQLENLGYV